VVVRLSRDARYDCVVTIEESDFRGNVLVTRLRLAEGSWPSAPLAPASIWRLETPADKVIDLHQLEKLEDAIAVFETFGANDVPPTPGDRRFSFFSWWTPAQFEAAADPGLEWHLREYDESDHEHCLLTWERINRGDEAFSSAAGWVTPAAFEKYIRDDVLRLRSR
jgi:hypothetical protein